MILSKSSIKFIYESSDGTKITHEIDGHADLNELLRQFEGFIKGMGYHPPEGELDFIPDDNETIDDMYADGYQDGYDVAKRELTDGTTNKIDHDLAWDGLDFDDCDLQRGIQPKPDSREQVRSELRNVSDNAADGGVDNKPPSPPACALCQDLNGSTEQCAACDAIYEFENEEIS